MSSLAALSPTSSVSSGANMSSQASTIMPPPSLESGSVHPSRPSLAVGYSQIPSNWSSAFTSSNAGIRRGADPNPSTLGAPSRIEMRPHASTRTMSNSATATTSPVATTGGGPPKQFVVPAHPQSHHLHSLPPREKTTRTLILDHTTWRHGRTRFAQGRCELGMKVRFKNQESGAERLEGEHGKRPGFYIGLSSGPGPSYKHPSDFGEPPEVDVASSDEDGDDDVFGHLDGEKVCALAYGRRFRQKRKELLKGAPPGSVVEAEFEDDSSSFSGSDEDEPHAFERSEDAQYAPMLAARAVGMEKVIHSMLIQRPVSPPTSPSPPPYGLQGGQTALSAQQPFQRSPSNSSMLPNGLRLRLSLAALVNDLFERQPSFSVSGPPDPSNKPAPPPSTASAPSHPSTSSPAGLVPLVHVSSQPFYTPPTLPSFHTLSLPSSSSSSANKFNSQSPQSPHPPAPFGGTNPEQRRPPPLFTWTRQTTTVTTSPTSPHPQTSLTHSADRPPATQLSRSGASGIASALPGSWTEVISRPSALSSGKTPLSKRAVGRSRDLYGLGCYISPSSMKTNNSFQRTVPTYSYNHNTALPKPMPEYPIEKLKSLCPRHLHEKCKICEPILPSPVTARGSMASSTTTTRPSTRIGAGLLKKEQRVGDGTGSVLADLVPRFLRISALVAMELGREARGEEPEMDESAQHRHQEDSRNDNVSGGPPSKSAPATSTSSSSHAQPTRAWFALLCGLITRGVLEGYVARGWKGAEYAEILIGVGLGIRGIGTRRAPTGFGTSNNGIRILTSESSHDQGLDEDKDLYEPDEMPTLIEACKMLFNGLVQDMKDPDSTEKITGLAEQEYISEMEERMSEFLTIPHATPDLATHLTGLSHKYPAEPVERAALRFCEAVANWRGKPELEMYKKLIRQNSSNSRTSSPVPPPLTLNALLASSPVPDRPPIHRYFRISSATRKATSPPPSSPHVLKRQRSMDDDGREAKKERIDVSQNSTTMEVDAAEFRKYDDDKPSSSIQAIPDSEWVGPYGL